MTATTIKVSHHKDTGRVEVTSPYDTSFVSRARAFGGTWDRGHKVWSFDESAEGTVRQALRDCYGTDGEDDGAEAVTLYVYVPSTISELGSALTLGGITLARAFGRDSGARLGDGVAHLAGPAPTSGGSVRYFKTVIPAGCLLTAYNVPLALAERALLEPRCASMIGDATAGTSAVLAQLSNKELV